MKFAGVILALLFCSVQPALPQHASSKHGGDLVVLRSADATGVVSSERLGSCERRLLKEWHLDEHLAPRIVVMHVSKEAARVASVTSNLAVRRNRGMEAGDFYYEIWVVDVPKIDDYLVAIENVIEEHFHLTPTDKQRKEILIRAARVENATVSVYEGK